MATNDVIIENLIGFWKNNGEKIIKKYKDQISIWPKDLEYKDNSTSIHTKFLRSSILILTANQVESNMIVRLLSNEPNNNAHIHLYIEKEFIYHFGEIEGIKIVHMQAKDISSLTKSGSLKAVQTALHKFQPKLVVSLGVAFGVDPSTQNLGDVIISKKLYVYDAWNKRTNGNLSITPDCSYNIHSDFNTSWKNILAYNKIQDLEDIVVHYGTVLSGGTVLSDEGEKQRIIKAITSNGEDNIVGGEMEGNGMFFACEEKGIPCVVIKGICDWGSLKNGWDIIKVHLQGESNNIKKYDNKTIKDCIQAYAMENAYKMLKYLIQYDQSLYDTYIKKKENQFKRNLNSFIVKFRHNCLTTKFFVLKQLLMTYIYLYFFVILYHIYDNYTSHSKLVLCVFIILYCIAGVFLVAINAKIELKLLSPIVFEPAFANIRICYLNFYECNCILENMENTSVNNFVIIWYSRKQSVPLSKLSCDTFSNMYLNANIFVCSLSDIEEIINSNKISIHPDTIQFEYDYLGNRFLHILTRKRLFFFNTQYIYIEYIYVHEENGYRLIYIKEYPDSWKKKYIKSL